MNLQHPSGPELTSQKQSHGHTPCFRWDEKEMRADTSSFLNTPSFDLGQGGVFPCHTNPWGAPALSPITSAHHPHHSGPLCPRTAQSHLYALDMALQYHTWWDLTFPASPRRAPQQAAQALHRQHCHATGSHAPLQALPAAAEHCTTSPPIALCTEIFHHIPLTKVPFLHE